MSRHRRKHRPRIQTGFGRAVQAVGIAGPPGPAGPAGAPGPQGPQGIPGALPLYDPLDPRWAGGAQLDNPSFDNAPVMQAIFDDIANGPGGGRILQPAGAMWIKSTTRLIPAGLGYQQVIWEGLGSRSIIVVAAPGLPLIVWVQVANFQIREILFQAGVPGTALDCDTVFSFNDVLGIGCEIDHCWFEGLAVSTAIVNADDTDISVKNCIFEGCRSDGDALIHFTNYRNARILDCNFEIIGGVNNTFIDKIPVVPSLASAARFVLFDTPGMDNIETSLEPTTTEVSGTRFNGGALIHCELRTSDAVNHRFERVRFESNNNVVFNTAGARGYKIAACDHVEVSRVRVDGSTVTKPAIEITDGGAVRIFHTLCLPDSVTLNGSTQITADATTRSVEMIDSTATLIPADPVATPSYIVQNGLRARLRFSEAAIVASTLGKPGATAGRVDQLGVADDVTLTSGVVLDDAGGAGVLVRVVEEHGQRVAIKSDGAGVLSPATLLTRSAVSAGRVAGTAPGSAHAAIADGSAAAVADALVETIF
jgi:hypothetical protein